MIFKNILKVGLLGLLFLVLFAGPQTGYALELCATQAPIPVSINISGYGSYANGETNATAHGYYSITVPYGTALTATYDSTGAGSRSDSFPYGNSYSYQNDNSAHTYTTDALTSNTFLSIGADRDCDEGTPPNYFGPGIGGDVTVSVTVTQPSYTLTVNKTGTGSGTVTGAGSYNSGVTATAGATASSGSTFDGWSGDCNASGQVVMNGNKTCTATFTLDSATTRNLSVSKAGTGSGTVTSNPSGINCGSDCSQDYTNPTQVDLTATPATGSTFAGWSGNSDCSNDPGGAMANPTGVNVNANKSCIATFTAIPAGTCSISVTSNAPTNWIIDSAVTNQLQSSGYPAFTQSGTYSGLPPGNYTISYATPQGWSSGSVSPGSSRTCSSGGSIAWTLTFVPDSVPVTGSCSVTPSSIATGQSATWSASPSGGNGTYTYSWSGTDSLSGTSQTIVKTYGTSGTKNGSVTISSNGESTGALSCGTVMVSTPEGFDIGQCLTPPDGGTYATAPTPACYIGTPSSISGSGPWTWTCVGSAGTDSCIAYKAITPTNGVCAAPPDGGTYTTAPTPACQVGTASSISGSGPWTWTCAGIAGGTTANCTAYKTTANPIIWVTSNIGTTYTITQGVNTVVDQTTPVTFKGHYNLGSGTYTIHPATKDGYGTPTVAPSATQDMTEADITFAINYPAAATTGMVIVESNLPTTWTLTGPSGVQTQGTNSLGVEYQDQSAGTYTLSNVPEKEGYTVTVESGGTLFAGGTLTLTITYTPDVTPPGGPSVDLKVNNSNGPVTIVSGSTALFTWTSSGVNKGTCVGSTDSRLNTWWDGAKSEESIAGERSDVISATTTYTITCDRSDAETTVTDSVVLGARPYACNDGYDNDGDGKVDYSTDPGCTSLIDDTEENSEPVNCQTDPSNPECAVQTEPVTQCNDGLDNDGDGKIDWNGAGAVLKDPGCKNAEDPSELDDPIIKEI